MNETNYKYVTHNQDLGTSSLYQGADNSLIRPGKKKVEKSLRLNWATQFLTVAYDGACFPNVSVRMVWISNDTIDSVLQYRELGRAKDLSAPRY
jgi:hypothetical protein